MQASLAESLPSWKSHVGTSFACSDFFIKKISHLIYCSSFFKHLKYGNYSCYLYKFPINSKTCKRSRLIPTSSKKIPSFLANNTVENYGLLLYNLRGDKYENKDIRMLRKNTVIPERNWLKN